MNEEWGDVILNPADVGAEVSLTPGKNGEQRFTLTLTGKVQASEGRQAATHSLHQWTETVYAGREAAMGTAFIMSCCVD